MEAGNGVLRGSGGERCLWRTGELDSVFGGFMFREWGWCRTSVHV